MTQALKITWKIEKRKVKDLIPLDKNPRKITKTAMEKLKDRILKRGFHDTLKLDSNGEDIKIDGEDIDIYLVT